MGLIALWRLSCAPCWGHGPSCWLISFLMSLVVAATPAAQRSPCGLPSCSLCNIGMRGFKLDKNVGRTALARNFKLRYGKGVYFSSVSGKANDYADLTAKVVFFGGPAQAGNKGSGTMWRFVDDSSTVPCIRRAGVSLGSWKPPHDVRIHQMNVCSLYIGYTKGITMLFWA